MNPVGDVMTFLLAIFQEVFFYVTPILAELVDCLQTLLVDCSQNLSQELTV